MDYPSRVQQRVLSRITVTESGCWESLYACSDQGYPIVGWVEDGQSRFSGAHRVAWASKNGRIPDGMTVDHVCHVRRCVNPSHLRILTRQENGRDNLAVRTNPPIPDRFCAVGHQLHRRASGRSYCPECCARRSREYSRRRRGL